MEKLKILNLNFSFQRAAHYHINGGMLLMGVVLLAMFLSLIHISEPTRRS